MSEIRVRAAHDRQHKVRLTANDDELLRALASRAGIPPAVLLRTWVRRHLAELDGQSVALGGRCARG